MKHIVYALMLGLVGMLVSGSGWGPLPGGGSGTVPDPLTIDSLSARAVESVYLCFNTAVYADTIKDLAAETITDSLYVQGPWITGLGSLGAYDLSSGPLWFSKLGAWMYSAGDSTRVCWLADVAVTTDSLVTYAFEQAATDSVTVMGGAWAYYEWTFPQPINIPTSDILLNFYCQFAAGGGNPEVYVGAVNVDSVAPTFFGILNSAATPDIIPNIRLFCEDGYRQDYVQATYDPSTGRAGVDVSALSCSISRIGALYTAMIGSNSPADPLSITSTVDFGAGITVNSTPTLTDSILLSTGDLFIVQDGLIIDIIPTP